MEKKHILMMTGDWGIANGKQNVFYEMLRGFSKYWDRVSVICPSNEKGEVIKIHDNVYLYPSSYSKTLHLDFFRHKNFITKKVREIHKEHPIDIMSAHVVPPLLANAKAAMKLSAELGVPYVAEVMHIPGYPKANNFLERIEKWTLDRFIKKNLDRIPNMRLINKFETYDYILGLGFPKDKILYIPAFYLDFDLFKPGDGAKDFRKFVFCGRLEKNKGLDLLIEAIELVARPKTEDRSHGVSPLGETTILKTDDKSSYAGCQDGFKVQFIGDGSLKGWLEDKIREKGLEDICEVSGWLPTRDDVAKAYQESGTILMTSYNEGGPRVTLEAMACGCLCISTPVGVMQEVVKDGKNAFFVDWDASDIAKKIVWTLENEDKAKEIAEQGRKDVQKFEYSEALKYYANSYEELA